MNDDALLVLPSRVRLAAPEDVKVVRAMALVAFAETKDTATPSPALTESVDDVRAAMARGGAALAEAEGLPLGSVRFAVDEGAHVLHFERLAVLPAARRHGIGSEFLTWLETHARHLDLRELQTRAPMRTPDQRPFFLKRGFEVFGTETNSIVTLRKRVAT